jgi:hypothetical protein
MMIQKMMKLCCQLVREFRNCKLHRKKFDNYQPSFLKIKCITIIGCNIKGSVPLLDAVCIYI